MLLKRFIPGIHRAYSIYFVQVRPGDYLPVWGQTPTREIIYPARPSAAPESCRQTCLRQLSYADMRAVVRVPVRFVFKPYTSCVSLRVMLLKRSGSLVFVCLSFLITESSGARSNLDDRFSTSDHVGKVGANR